MAFGPSYTPLWGTLFRLSSQPVVSAELAAEVLAMPTETE